MAVQSLKARRASSVAVASAMLALAVALAIAGPVRRAGADAPSDPRATFVEGNATTCADVGFASSTQVGGTGGSASDANVTGTVQTNAGPINPGQGDELNV